MIPFRRRVSYWRQNKWTRRLPLEIITRVLFYAIADALSKREVFGELPLLKAFPELYHLILLIKDVPSTTSLNPQGYIRRGPRERVKREIKDEARKRRRGMKKFLKGMKCVTLQNYALLPHIYARTPIKIFVASHDMLSRPTTMTLDRSRFSLLSRFLKPNNFVILPLNSGMMEFYGASGAWCFEMAGLEPWEDRTVVFEVDARFLVGWPFLRGDRPFVLLKCQTPEVIMRQICGLQRLDVVMSDGGDDTVQPWLEIVRAYPSELLRVRFTSFLVPLIRTLVEIDGGDEGKPQKHCKLVLENVNWTEETPYGVCVQEGEQDQWEWNGVRLDDRWDDNVFRPFRQVFLVGIPEFLVALFDWRRVVSLHWGRLSAHEPLQQEEFLEEGYLPLTLSFPRLQRLSIISVWRRKEYFPQFEAPRLKKLELLSLMDSNTPWDVGNVLTGESRELTDVYMEHRGKPGISINPESLDPVAPSIQKLHIRGYLPALGGPSITRFVKLRTMMLDVSHISTTLSILEDPISSPGRATIVLPQITYPALQSLTLMCTGREILTNTHMELTIPPTVRLLQISASVNPLSITVNKIPLSVPPGLKQEEIPIVQSRLCSQYRSMSRLLSRRKFIYVKRVVIKDNWLQEYREY